MVNKRCIIIGLDGVPFGLIDDLAQKGVMSNTREIISKGEFRKMESSIPEISSVAWSSIITGKNPAEHGIFGFTDIDPASLALRFPNFDDLKAKPFWELIEGKPIILNVPSTYPVKPMNGIHISGFVSTDLEKAVFPKELIAKLKGLDYRIDVDSQIAHQSLDLFLEDLQKTLEARIKTYRWLLGEKKWQVFMPVFTGTDRLMHFLWNAYEEEGNKYHGDFLDHFRQIDQMIGEIYSELKEDDLLVLLSDHGFEKLEKEVYINGILEKEGFLKLNKGKEALAQIDPSSQAFSLDPARIYLNFKNKYASGVVAKEDKEKILRELEGLFSSLEVEGKKVIRSIYQKEEIYSGPFLDRAPDLTLVGNKGFNLKARLSYNNLFDKGLFEGKHTQDDAFLLVKNCISEIKEKPSVFDIYSLVLENIGK